MIPTFAVPFPSPQAGDPHALDGERHPLASSPGPVGLYREGGYIHARGWRGLELIVPIDAAMIEATTPTPSALIDFLERMEPRVDDD